MPKKDRDYDAILKGCKSFSDAIKDLQSCAKMLDAEADASEATLKDDVAKKNIDSIKNLAETILKVTKTGEERVRELERKMQREKDQFEAMR